MPRRGLRNIVIGLILGWLVGAALAQLIGHALGPSPLQRFFFDTYRLGFSPVNLYLGFLTLTFGFYLMLSVFAVLFAVVVAIVFSRL